MSQVHLNRTLTIDAWYVTNLAIQQIMLTCPADQESTLTLYNLSLDLIGLEKYFKHRRLRSTDVKHQNTAYILRTRVQLLRLQRKVIYGCIRTMLKAPTLRRNAKEQGHVWKDTFNLASSGITMAPGKGSKITPASIIPDSRRCLWIFGTYLGVTRENISMAVRYEHFSPCIKRLTNSSPR